MTGAEYSAFLGASVILAVTPGPDTFLTLRFAARSVRGGLVYTAAAGLGVLVWAVLALTGVAALLERFPDVRVGLTWVGGSYLVFLGASALLQVRRARKEPATSSAAGSSFGGSAGTEESAARAVPDVAALQAVPEAAMAGTRAEPHGTPRGSAAAPAAAVAPPRQGIGAHPGQGADVEPRLPVRSLPTVFRTGLLSSLTNPKTGLFFLALLPPFLPESPGPVEHVVLVATVVGCMLVYGAGLSVVAARVGRFLTGGSGPLIVDGTAGAILVVLGVSLVVL